MHNARCTMHNAQCTMHNCLLLGSIDAKGAIGLLILLIGWGICVIRGFFRKNVRLKGLEPSRLAAPDPKSGASTNFATSANVVQRYKFSRLSYK